MQARPRIDLEGVALHDEKNPFMIIAIFRYRMTEGLLLLIPESADVLVEWRHVVDSAIELGTGKLRIRFTPDYVATQNWLRGATTLVGPWMDRFTMSRASR